QAGLALSEARAKPGADPARLLAERILAERMDCPGAALGLLGVGLLEVCASRHEVQALPADAGAALASLAARLTDSPAPAKPAAADAALAGAVVRFMLEAYGAPSLIAFARAMG